MFVLFSPPCLCTFCPKQPLTAALLFLYSCHRSANLNKSYFTDRQDRYIQFTASPSLANYCFDFLQTISKFSYRLLPHESPSSISGVTWQADSLEVSWTDPDTHPHHIESKASALLSKFQASHLSAPVDLQSSDTLASAIGSSSTDVTTKPADSDDEVYVFPVIQAGQFNIREEERALNLLYSRISPSSPSPTPIANITAETENKDKVERPLVNLTSGYFGLYEPYQDLILSSDVDTRIVCAAPKVGSSSESCTPFFYQKTAHSRDGSFCSAGKWLLRILRYFRTDTRRLHVTRATLHEGRSSIWPFLGPVIVTSTVKHGRQGGCYRVGYCTPRRG